jgi:hypothetical protein
MKRTKNKFELCYLEQICMAPTKTAIQHLWIGVLYKVSGKIVDNRFLQEIFFATTVISLGFSG